MDGHIEVVLAAIADLKHDVGGIHTRLDTLNGRTRIVETAVAKQWLLWVIAGAVASAALAPAIMKLFGA